MLRTNLEFLAKREFNAQSKLHCFLLTNPTTVEIFSLGTWRKNSVSSNGEKQISKKDESKLEAFLTFRVHQTSKAESELLVFQRGTQYY